jgi:hypothetical protein
LGLMYAVNALISRSAEQRPPDWAIIDIDEKT